MKSLLKIFAAMLLSMSLANCAMLGLSGDDDESKSEEPTTVSDTDKEAMDTDDKVSEDFNDSDIGDKSEAADLDTPDTEGGDDLDDDAAVGEQGYLSSGAETTPVADAPVSTPDPARGEASAPFKDGMYTFSEDCTMRQDPESTAPSAGTVRGGKKLWVEGYDNSWVKVFKKNGPVFVSKSCL